MTHQPHTFEEYRENGLRVIALHPGTKKPIGGGWTGRREEWRLFRDCPDANLGLLLGKVVDVEGDSDRANELLTRTIGGVPHPMYRSSKSVHHLFLTPDPWLTRLSFEHVEFRGGRHQSVLPPSVHEDGSVYAWLPESRFPVPIMPPALKRLYHRGNAVSRGKPWVKPGHRACRCRCGVETFLHAGRHDLEILAFKTLDSPWLCQECRKAAGIDVRPLCRRLKRAVERCSDG